MRAKKLFSILLAMMLMLFALFPIQAVLAETTNQPSQTTGTAEPPASSAVPTQRSDTPAPTSGAEPGAETPVDVSGQLGFFVQQYGLMVLLALAVIVLVVLIVLLARSKKKKPAKMGQTKPVQPIGDAPQTQQLLGSPERPVVAQVGNLHNIGQRAYQQDAFGVSPLLDEKMRFQSRGVLAVLADGMGGMKGSGELSQAAVYTALKRFPHMPGDMRETLASLTSDILNMVQTHFADSGAGSTLIMANIRGGMLDFISIGDSRIALLRSGKLMTLNREHNYAATLHQQAAQGLLSWQEATENLRRRALTSYLGQGNEPAIDFPAEPIRLQCGDMIVLMSDGVYGTLDDETLERHLIRSKNAMEAAEAIEKEVLSACKRNQDNFTAVLIEIRDELEVWDEINAKKERKP